MQLSPSLNLRQKQSLVMTPQLQQAIKLLQMTNLDLTQYLEEQTAENPFLEIDDKKSEKEDIQAVEKEVSNETPADNSIDEGMKEGTAIKDDPTKAEDYENRFDNELVDFGGSSGSSSSSLSITDSGSSILENTIEGRAKSLYSHSESQIHLIFSEPSDHFIAMKFLENLEPSGWISKTCEEIAELCGTTSEITLLVLEKLQTIEPIGLFARNLSECLLLQVRGTEHFSPTFEIFLENLPMLAKGDLKGLAKKCSCEESNIKNFLRIIRGLNPKPGAIFDNDIPQISAPDLIVKKGKDGWIVDLNRSTLPSIVVNEDYASKVVTGKTKDNSLNLFANQAVASARWLKRALDQRNSTTLKISAEIVRSQTDFLENGLDFLKPLSLRHVAEAVGMHESTVSRVTTGLLMNTPRGTFTVKSFFSVSIQSNSNGVGTSAAAVRHMISKMISDETPGKPLSDDAIAQNVSKRGVQLARRTVAKYRDILHIPSSSERRRQAKLEQSL